MQQPGSKFGGEYADWPMAKGGNIGTNLQTHDGYAVEEECSRDTGGWPSKQHVMYGFPTPAYNSTAEEANGGGSESYHLQRAQSGGAPGGVYLRQQNSEELNPRLEQQQPVPLEQTEPRFRMERGYAPSENFGLARSVSYSHNLPDTIPELIIDNDRLRRQNLRVPENIARECLEAWTDTNCPRLIQFTVDEIPSYYATWSVQNKFDWVVWTVPNITGLALLSEKFALASIPRNDSSGLNVNHSSEDNSSSSRSIIEMLFRTNRVQVTSLKNAQHAQSLLQYLCEVSDLSERGDRAMYMYINSLPEFVESLLSQKLPFINAVCLSLYQKILSSYKPSSFMIEPSSF